MEFNSSDQSNFIREKENLIRRVNGIDGELMSPDTFLKDKMDGNERNKKARNVNLRDKFENYQNQKDQLSNEKNTNIRKSSNKTEYFSAKSNSDFENNINIDENKKLKSNKLLSFASDIDKEPIQTSANHISESNNITMYDKINKAKSQLKQSNKFVDEIKLITSYNPTMPNQHNNNH